MTADGGAGAAASDRPAELTHRFRLAVGCLVLAALAFLQQPGRIVADTKLDLVVDPGGFLQRSLTMWDAEGFLGQVQNQAYGYLFPMGPFFWLGRLADLDPWVVQRLWWALLWGVAFVGMARLARALGVGTPNLQLLAGLLYALSPRVLTIMGVNSIEAWPASLAPWVLLPLVVGVSSGRPRLRAAQSALAVGCIGGVNAVATAAVLPLATLWLLMAPRGESRRRMLLWWPPLVLAVTAWWWLPLVLLGRYSPPFLDHIESSATTTVSASVLDALRGTTNWVPRATGSYEAGRDLLLWPSAVVALAVVAAIGLAGLAHRRMPHQRFLVAGVLAGVVLTTIGHTAGVAGWGAAGLQDLLDGPLAAMRNLHKFDPVVRIPIVLGAVHLLAVVLTRVGEITDAEVVRWWRRSVAVVVAAGVAAAIAPVWTARVANPGSFLSVPDYWSEAATWLGAQPDSTTLLVPSSRFGDYLWGSTGDDVMQPLAQSAWTTRPLVPLTPEGTVRLLDSVTDELASGAAAPSLATTLDRAGIDHLLIRFDLAEASDPERAELAWRTLRSTPGMELAETFGPPIGGPGQIDDVLSRRFVDGGWRTRHPAIAVFAVEDADEQPTSAPLEEVPVVVGGADAVTGLDRLGVLEPGPVLLAGDRPEDATGPWVLTDGLRRSEIDFALVDRNRSASLATDDPYTLDRATHDFVSDADADSLSVPSLRGAERLTASSSRGWVNSAGVVSPSAAPWAAFDSDARTAWRAVGGTGRLDLELGEPRDVGVLTLRAGLAPGETQQVTIGTEDGDVSRTMQGDTPVRVGVGEVDAVRIEVERAEADDGQAGDAQLADVTAAGLHLSRPLVLPEVERVDRVVLGLDQGERPSCLDVGGVDQCRPGVGDPGEDAYDVDRVLTLGEGGTFEPAITTRAVAGAPLDALVQQGSPLQVRTSSTVSSDPRSTGSRMIDGNRQTGWIAADGDARPTVTMTWATPQTVSVLGLETTDSLPASSVDEVTVTTDDGTTVTADVADGVAIIPEITTTSLSLELTSARDAVDDERNGLATHLPVGLSEISVLGAPAGLVVPGLETLDWGCGTGPDVTIDGTTAATALSASAEELLAGAPVPARLCGDVPTVSLPDGESRLTVTASGTALAGQLVLTSTTPWRAAASGQELVTVRHNANAGWDGTVDGRSVPAVVVNGWQQGYVVEKGDVADLTEAYGPGATYRSALVGGGVLALVVALGAIGATFRSRRRPATVPPIAGDSRWSSRVVLGAAGAVTLAAVAGVPGLLALVAAIVLGAAVRRRGAVAVIATTVVIAGGIVTAVVADPTTLTPQEAQWCGVVGLALLVGSALDLRWPRRFAGRSTTR